MIGRRIAMINNNDELKKYLYKFCEEKNIDPDIFEIARVGTAKGSSPRFELHGPSTVKNENCTYVIKLFTSYNLIIIWNYRNNHSMSYSYKTMEEKLKNGKHSADKGTGTHTNKQSIVLFERSENFSILLNDIAGNL
jgi:hypothetical protein